VVVVAEAAPVLPQCEWISSEAAAAANRVLFVLGSALADELPSGAPEEDADDGKQAAGGSAAKLETKKGDGKGVILLTGSNRRVDHCLSW
jgi:hypothetical protein